MKNSKAHFDNSYALNTFLPPQEIEFAIYSRRIWNGFLGMLGNKNSGIVDLGCGGGTVLYCLERLGYGNLYGMDFCNVIPPGFLKKTRFYEGDIMHSTFKTGFFDGLVSTMTIEHVDEHLFVNEVSRVLKPGGAVLITSVLKNRFSWYFYKNSKGESVVEPTHVKEYKSREEFEGLFKKDFHIVDTCASRLVYPVIDPLFKLFYRYTKMSLFREMPTRNYFFKKMRTLRMPVLGYYAIETILKKK
jgi:SAM-dependent methyltransferase